MNLHEYQAKTVFGSFGIPIIEGRVATTPEEARAHAEALGGMVVVKAQVHTGGRGKAGGVKLAKDAAEAEARARDILGLDIKGHIVETILIVPASDISKEYYLSITLDRGSKRPVIIASAEGGIDIEEVAAKTPEKIFRYHLDRPGSFKSYEARLVASKLESDPKIQLKMARIVEQLVNCFWATDASLVEINPLITNPEGQVIALDAKMSVDDNALYKHPHLVAFREDSDEHAKAAREMGLSYVPLEGNVGCIVNGAGLAMATMDLIKHFGGEPANFLDIGGSSNPEKVSTAMRIILADPEVKAILINIFGGITRCDDVARGMLAAFETLDVRVPVVARLTGTNEKEAQEILSNSDAISPAETMDDAVKLVLEKAK